MSYMYGSFTAVIVFMLWIYFLIYIMFIGAEINKLLFPETEATVTVKMYFNVIIKGCKYFLAPFPFFAIWQGKDWLIPLPCPNPPPYIFIPSNLLFLYTLFIEINALGSMLNFVLLVLSLSFIVE